MSSNCDNPKRIGASYKNLNPVADTTYILEVYFV